MRDVTELHRDGPPAAGAAAPPVSYPAAPRDERPPEPSEPHLDTAHLWLRVPAVT